MLAAFGKAFKTPDLRVKIFFTLAIMGLFTWNHALHHQLNYYSAADCCYSSF